MSQQTEDTSKVELPEYLVPPEARTSLKEVFEPMKRDVELHIYTVEESQDVFSRFVRQLGRELGETSPKISVVSHSGAEGLSDITALPQIVIQGKGAQAPVLHMVGAPLGEEGKVLVQGIMLAGSDESGLSKGAKAELATLKEKRVIKVFGTGT